jgi:peroxiredoxin
MHRLRQLIALVLPLRFPCYLVIMLGISYLPSGCKNEKVTVIRGRLSAMSGQSDSIFLSVIRNYNHVFLNSQNILFSAAKVDREGYFEFRLDSLPCTECLYRIHIAPRRNELSPANIALFELKQGSELTIQADANNFTHTIRIEKPDELWDFSKVRDIRLPASRKFKEILHQKSLLAGKPQIDIDSLNKSSVDQINEAYADNDIELKKFIIASDVFYDKFMGLKECDFASTNDNIQIREELLASIDENFTGHAFTDQLKREIQTLKANLSVGDLAPEFSLPDSRDVKLNFKNIRNDLILLDFWASWCKPCREECRSTLKPLWEKYKGDGFMIISISTDEKKEHWLKAVAKDEMTWINVVEADAGKVTKIYSAQALPTYYLVDGKSRKILAKNLRGTQLEDFVDNYFADVAANLK